MSKQVAEVFQYHYQKRSKKRNLTVRVITVIHYIMKKTPNEAQDSIFKSNLVVKARE
ncbi:hypothetical protein MXL46_15025 [Heyndrickxia sporothermodurans]|uniref:Ribosomal protein S7 n=1 Tax=Heyndrickxia sporothermodurans TaxID=46224 RepID=A0AB37HGG8_9BACI|nr:hypothetical protein [Heyndrickxia sporothermodurans]MBL5769123.1 hypothetical protein [Heyndrickxia sporothermodurans]MBL5772905.1 hypothetical protein [Heyndrickxia sporothermodurans]MBL5776359.1 hypothetical protein [Heyndrickxia sporothermodurans]MBL5779902.1 hypothetical protein [Heyndrickxia sporothermodurans]MBL5783495.1 hypothetical protein [Heyndrickxia sporothermodurans]